MSRKKTNSESRSKQGRLFVVGTSIGNLEDVTFRAIRTLRECDLIAAEDTRVAKKLLMHYGISTQVVSYHQHSNLEKVNQIVSNLKSGRDVALISDAGMPGISDPGQELIIRAVQLGIPIVPVPGPSALIAITAVSGLAEKEFVFLGYPPRKRGERVRFFAQYSDHRAAIVFYEAPTRFVASLEAALEALGDRQIVVGRELTKIHEEIFRGLISESIARFSAGEIKGEVSAVIAGASGRSSAPSVSDLDCISMLKAAIGSGMTDRDAVKKVSTETGLSKKRIYDLMLRLKEN